MATIKILLLLAIGLASRVAAHGFIRTASADGETCKCYNPNYHPFPTCTASIPTDTDNGYIDHNGYRSRDIICHKGATVGDLTLKVEAGHDIELQWTKWPESHHGYIMNALSNCNGPCQDANLEELNFNMINKEGFLGPNPSVKPGDNPDGQTCGKWALDVFRQGGSKYKFTVPSCLAPGNYLFRQEFIALHSAMPEGSGAQHIPQCLSIEVTGSGTDKLAGGTSPMTWYDQKSTTMNIYNNLPDYPMVGPDLYPICRNTPSQYGFSAAAKIPKAQPSVSHNYASETPTAYNVTKVSSTGYRSNINGTKGYATESGTRPTLKPTSSSSYTPKESKINKSGGSSYTPTKGETDTSGGSSYTPTKGETDTSGGSSYTPKKSNTDTSGGSSYTPKKGETNKSGGSSYTSNKIKADTSDTSNAKLAVSNTSNPINGYLTMIEMAVKKLRHSLTPYRRRHSRDVVAV